MASPIRIQLLFRSDFLFFNQLVRSSFICSNFIHVSLFKSFLFILIQKTEILLRSKELLKQWGQLNASITNVEMILNAVKHDSFMKT